MERLSGAFSNRDGVLYVEGVSSLQIARELGTPTYVTSEARIRANYRRLFKAFSSLKKFRLYYAVKANSNLALLSILRQEGAYADCSSPAEIYEATLAGFSPDKLLYTGNYITAEELQYALEAGVTVNLDDAAMVRRIPPSSVPEIICLRINPGIGRGGREGLVFAGPDAKFGSSEEVAVEGLKEAKRIGIRRFGIHMMTGSNVLEPSYFPRITGLLMDIAGRMASKVGLEYEFVNIGGGFGVPYAPGEVELPIEQVAKDVVSVFKSKVDQYGLGDPVLAAEPGRFLVADSTILLSKVCHIKTETKVFVGIDAGMNTLVRPALYKAYHEVLAAGKLNAPKELTANVCGQICENTDILAKDRSLPRLEEGDILAILNAGAYGFSMSSQYNNRPRAAEALVSGERLELIRRREDISDLLRGQYVPPRLLR